MGKMLQGPIWLTVWARSLADFENPILPQPCVGWLNWLHFQGLGSKTPSPFQQIQKLPRPKERSSDETEFPVFRIGFRFLRV